MNNRFKTFSSEEKALIFVGLCKINISTNDPQYQTLQELIGEFTK